MQYASTKQINRHIHIARDFFNRVLNVNHDSGFFLDESSLNDFLYDEAGEEIELKKQETINRILLLYNVDIASILNELLYRYIE